MRKRALFSSVTSGLCMVLWCIRIVQELNRQTNLFDPFFFALEVFTLVAWTVAFFINLKRYRSAKEE